MDYASYRDALRNILVVKDTTGSANFDAILPNVIEYAEKRIYRQFDFLSTRTADVTQVTTAGIRTVHIPDRFIVIDTVALITPAGSMPTDADAKRVTLLRMDRPFLDTTWPTESLTQPPKSFETYYALFSQEEISDEGAAVVPNNILIAPTPDGAYNCEFTGTFRPPALSVDNTQTVLTELYPDLFLAASLVFSFGYLRQFGAQSDDPRSAMSWETQYGILAQGVNIESARQKSASTGWSPYQPYPLARSQRSGHLPGGGGGGPPQVDGS